MIAILDNRCLTDEVLSTTMCLVEQALNAIPLTAESDEPEDLTALTTDHVLLGQENACAPFMPSSERYQSCVQNFVHPKFGRENLSNPMLWHIVMVISKLLMDSQMLWHQTHKCGY